jgi:quinol monooxygenase YgiN
MPNFYSTAILKINEGADIQEALTTIKQLGTATRQEAGNITFTVLQQKENPQKIIVWECFVDKDAFELHLASAHLKTFIEKGLFGMEAAYEGELI